MRPSGGVDKLAGCFVFDLWGGRYADTARALGRAASYGLQDSMVVWHNWQRWGYDYPDAEGFSYEHIAAGRDGAPVKAWLNEGRQAQSYGWRADRLTPFLERNLRAVRDGFAPTGYFIDVWSSAGPYDYWTLDGQFFSRLLTRKVWGGVVRLDSRFVGRQRAADLRKRPRPVDRMAGRRAGQPPSRRLASRGGIQLGGVGHPVRGRRLREPLRFRARHAPAWHL